VGERAEGCHVAPSLRGLPAQYRRAIPRLASTPTTVPHSTIETICHRMTALRDAPNDTIAAEVIWLGRIVWPMMLTPATPYLSKRARSFARRGLSDWAGRPLRTFERTPWAVSTTTSIERTLPTIAAGMATAGWMPPTTPMMAPPYDSTKGTAPAIITPSHGRNAGRSAVKSRRASNMGEPFVGFSGSRCGFARRGDDSILETASAHL